MSFALSQCFQSVFKIFWYAMQCLKNLRRAVASPPHKDQPIFLFIFYINFVTDATINCTCFLICRPINLNNKLTNKKIKKTFSEKNNLYTLAISNLAFSINIGLLHSSY